MRAIFPMFREGGSEHHGKYFDIPAAQCGAQAGAEAASAIVDGVFAASDHRARGPERFWRARLPVRQRRCGARLGACLLQCHHQAAEEARRLRDQPEHGAGVVFHVCENRRGGEGARRWRDVLPVRAALLRRVAEPPASGARHRQHVGRIQQVEARKSGGAGGGIARRPDRIARNHPQEAAPVQQLTHRPGDPAQSGRQEQPRAHLRVAGIVRQGSDAGIPQRSRTRCMESRRDERRDQARGDRYRSVQGSLRQTGGQCWTSQATAALSTECAASFSKA